MFSSKHLPGILFLFFLLHLRWQVMINFLIEFPFFLILKPTGNQTGAVLGGCGIDQIVCGINKFLVIFLHSETS